MIDETLRQIGLTEGESKIYLALLHLGSTTTGNIVRASGVSSSKVYVILDKLQEKGLVSYILQDKVKHFQATNPKLLLEYLSQKQIQLQQNISSVQTILPELERMRSQETQIQEATMSQGYKGYDNSLFEFISKLKKGDEFLVFGARRVFTKQVEIALKKFYTLCDERGIRTRLIYNEELRDTMLNMYKSFPLVSLRFISHITPSTIVIGKDTIIVFAYGDDMRQVSIKSTVIAQSFLDFFESMWAISKE